MSLHKGNEIKAIRLVVKVGLAAPSSKQIIEVHSFGLTKVSGNFVSNPLVLAPIMWAFGVHG